MVRGNERSGDGLMEQVINLQAICIADGFGICLAVLMLGAGIWKNGRNEREGRLLRIMLLTAIVSCIMDSVSFISDGQPELYAMSANILSNFWLYLSNLIMGTLWTLVLIAHMCGDRLPKSQNILTVAVDAAGVLILVANIFYPLVYSIGPDNVYSKGPLFWLYLAIDVVFIFDGVIVYFVYRKKQNETKYFPVWQYIIPLLAGIAVQSSIYGVSTIWPAITIAICGVVLGLFNENEAETEVLRQHEVDTRIILQQKNRELAYTMENERRLEQIRGLAEAGLIVESTENGKLAVDEVTEKGTDYYDFVLMDIQMPVMNGYEATAEIRKLPGGNILPIIALSANAFTEDVEKSLAAGMDAHVAKPIDIGKLLSTMQALKKTQSKKAVSRKGTVS